MKKSYVLIILIFSILIFPLFAAEDWYNANPATNPTGRLAYGFTYINDGKVLSFGGAGGGLGNETWVYDVSDNTWTDMDPTSAWVSGNNVPEPRRMHGMAYIGDDKALVFGGITGSGGSSRQNDMWLYDYSDNTWTKITPI